MHEVTYFVCVSVYPQSTRFVLYVEHIYRLYAIIPRFSTYCEMLFSRVTGFFAIPSRPFCPYTNAYTGTTCILPEVRSIIGDTSQLLPRIQAYVRILKDVYVALI